MHVVPHLSGCGVVGGKIGIFTGGSLETFKLILATTCVHQEAHAPGNIGFGDGRGTRIGGSSSPADGKQTESKNDGLEDKEDEKVGEVEGENLGG